MSPRTRAVPRLVVAALLILLASGCFTGKRPKLSDDPFSPGTPTGNADVDAILTLLDRAASGPATVQYEILRKADPKTTAATVVVRGSDLSVTVGDVRYLDLQGLRQTCTQGMCTDTWQAQRISDTGVTPQFYDEQIARKLRRYVPALIGPVVASTEDVGGTSAECRGLPLSGGTAKYCVYPSGLIASADDGDIRITATSTTPAADEAAFRP